MSVETGPTMDSALLLKDLQRRVVALHDDLRARAAEPETDRLLREEHAAARQAQRTAATFESWREEPVTQAAVAWVLGTVFVRFLEDNRLIEAWISGPDDRRAYALDRHAAYFEQHPLETDREYLQHVFRQVGALPAAGELFDPAHNPLWRITPSGDAAKALLELWRRIDPATGAISYDFTDPAWDTRLLGDLYQDLSEAARKKYALLQTPEFVERFILDRTLTPAIETFGYRTVTLIDPACGSGHFLLGAFARLLAEYQRHEPAVNVREYVQHVLKQVSGVDLNPSAAVIARFRLLIAALRASGITRLADAPAFEIQVGTGDALLHGKKHGGDGALQIPLDPDDPNRHHFFAEDPRADEILGRRHHVVVGNPPYIVVRDRALSQLYRKRYATCHMKYSLVVPFVERFFDLTATDPAGYVGLIGANSFMKREFGSKLIEKFLPRVDLTHVVDTSGAYIPGHGTPTVILFGRHRPPSAPTRTVMGIRGEPSTPDDPAKGQVWTAMLRQIDELDSESAFVSVRDLEQRQLHTHPWSIGGGGAAELKELLDERATKTLGDLVASVGFMAITGEDDVFVVEGRIARIKSMPSRSFITGDAVRDWTSSSSDEVIFPYEGDSLEVVSGAHRETAVAAFLWPLRVPLRARRMFGKSPEEHSGRWFGYMQFIRERAASPLLIAFAEVATHNHFVLDRGGKVFKQTAPVIKLPVDATEDDHLALLGLLNSSTACFWMKQVAHQKQLVGGDGVRVEFRSKVPFQFSGTQLGELPIAAAALQGEGRNRLVGVTRKLVEASEELYALAASAVVARVLSQGSALNEAWQLASERRQAAQERMVVLQEQLDFLVYELYGLVGADVTVAEIPDGWFALVGTRPFELLAGSNQDGFPVPGHVPDGWPQEQRALWERRMEAIRCDAELRVIEDGHYKRRWIGRQGLFNHGARRDEWAAALELWLLDRLEDRRNWPATGLTTTAALADVVRRDAEWMQVAEAYRGRADFDVTALVTELVTSEGVPYLPALRYKESGLRKRAQWEATWELQRAEDAIDARIDLPEGDPQRLTREEADHLKREQIGDIPVPPKYASADFRKSDYWRLRGKLDVPKERFILYPGAERAEDPTPVVGWAAGTTCSRRRRWPPTTWIARTRAGARSASPRSSPASWSSCPGCASGTTTSTRGSVCGSVTILPIT